MQERVLFIRDASFEREDVSPYDAIMVFITTPHTELDMDIRIALTGSRLRSDKRTGILSRPPSVSLNIS